MLLTAALLLWFAKRHASPPQALPPIKFQQLTNNSTDNPVSSGSISPDGRYLAYVDTQGLHAKEIETGATQEIPQPAVFKTGSVTWDVPEGGWFPDSTMFIANAHPAGEGPEAWSSRTSSIWKFSRLGGVPHELREHAFAGSVSPDGSLIPFGTSAGRFGEREVWVVGPNGEQGHKLVDTGDESWFGPMLWSPHGKHGLVTRTDASGDTILSLDLHGAPPAIMLRPDETRQLFQDVRGDLWWLPDGRAIYQVVEPSTGVTALQDTC